MEHAPRPNSWTAFARAVIERAVRGEGAWSALLGEPIGVPLDDGSPHGGAFVTLHLRRRLRGCMGTLDEMLPLAEAVRSAALRAALDDPRFQPVTVGELREVRISVSILSLPRVWAGIDELVVGRHGIIVQRDERRGLFLPQVAVDHQLTAEQFLSMCCTEKAGLAADAWRDGTTTVRLFTTRIETEEP